MMDKDKLRNMYHRQNMTQAEIANKVGVVKTTISRWMKKYEIETRGSHPQSQRPQKSKLKELYHEKGMNQEEIARKFDVKSTTVSEWMKKYKIKVVFNRSRRKKVPELFHNQGYEMFTNNQENFLHHRLLAVAEFGFDSVKGKHVHHRNKIRWDNRPQNIELMTPSEHSKHHSK